MTINEKRIMVFGGTGSLGQALVRRMAGSNEVCLYSRDEAKHWTIRNRLRSDQTVRFVVGDIRDYDRVSEALLHFNPEYVIIASALKQVDTCELSPFESIQTNVLGIRNVIEAIARQHERLVNLEAVLLVSTDKACAPTNVYGMCKALAERLVLSASLSVQQVRFVAVRYGNVLESRGSIIPLFRHQAEHQEALTVTHEEMTRFIMTLDGSIDLIEAALAKAATGELWLPKLHSMRILDLANLFADRFGKRIVVTGIRPGEKLHEDLISEPESIRVREESGYFKMTPAFADVAQSGSRSFRYTSQDELLPQDALEVYLDSLGIFERSLEEFVGRQIEEIRTAQR